MNTVKLTSESLLVVVDDEDEAFGYWEKAIDERIRDMGIPEGMRPQLVKLRSPSELRANEGGLLQRGTMFLVDQQFGNDPSTGLEIIEELSLQGRCILVTNHFEQSAVTEAAVRLGVKILPKTYMLNARFPIELGGA